MGFVCDQFGECRSRGGRSNASTRFVSLQGSVGRGGRNIRNDVGAVQDALNQIDPIAGGPQPLLKVDSICGPKTIGAIERFQKAQFGLPFPDARMDPGKTTVTRLNELLNRSLPVAGGSGSGSFGIRSNASAFGETTTNEQMDLARRLARDAERRIAAALVRLTQATAALPKKTRTGPEPNLVREVDWHFKASADPTPAVHLAKVFAVYTFMLTAIREQNLGIREIFRAGTHPDPTAIAAAELGGFFSSDQNERFIIITPQFRTQSSQVIVHELAHFCGGNRTSGSDVVHRASPKPPPNGRQLEDGTTDYRNMSPFHARTNAISYQVYCFPEIPEFRVP